jgi:uncharacterized protein (TIGR02421 family)
MTTAATADTLAARVLRGFGTDAHTRERLPGAGVLNLDRKLPCLFVYRQPSDRSDPGTERLVLGEAAYLVMPESSTDELHELLLALARAATAEFGSFLVVELWAGAPDSRSFVVHAPTGTAASSARALERGLASLSLSEFATDVRFLETDDRYPPDMSPLLSARECWEIGCLSIGLEVPPLYRDTASGDVYPVFLRRMRQLLSPVLRTAAYEFARVQTSASIESFRALGPRSFGHALDDADRTLVDIEQSFQLLLLVAPTNTTEAWQRFRDDAFARPPEFRYRLLPVDPDLLKRRLFDIDLDSVADPAMAFILRDKRDELDRQVTLIAERNTTGFLYASMRLYGPLDDVLLQVAKDILTAMPPPAKQKRALSFTPVSATDFAERARAELDYYRQAMPTLAADVQVRSDLMGLMVSQGNLLIGEGLSLRPHRVEPLLHHEVGTHVLTYYNGRAQPLRQLYTGLADYDELQEGLAVLCEYLADGLDSARIRVLAARVIAVHSVISGATFLDTFRLLVDSYGFSRGTAFDIAERVHQSGGFTRDMIYLRGVLRLIEYIRAGGALEPLFVGKLAARHIEIIDELRARGFLNAAPLTPRLFTMPGTKQRLDAVRKGLTLIDMVSDG